MFFNLALTFYLQAISYKILKFVVKHVRICYDTGRTYKF